jgi:hypothetical protein
MFYKQEFDDQRKSGAAWTASGVDRMAQNG